MSEQNSVYTTGGIILIYFHLPIKTLMKDFPTFSNSLCRKEKNILLTNDRNKYNPREFLEFKDRIFGIHRDICIVFVCDPLKQLCLFPELCCSLGLQCNSRKRCISCYMTCMFHSTCLPLNVECCAVLQQVSSCTLKCF